MAGAQTYWHRIKNFRRVGIIVTCCFAIILLFSPALHASVINIPDDQPTIQAGIDAAVDGDTVLVAPGTYIENITYLRKNIALLSVYGASQTFVEPANPDSETIIMNAQYAELRGFTLIGGGGPMALKMYNGVSDLVADNIFRDYAGLDAVVRCRCNALITRNLFYNNEGVSCIANSNNATASIINNTFYGNTRGFHSSNGLGVARNNIVLNSTEYGIWGEFEELDYNCLWDNSPNYENCTDTGSHSISVDPEMAAPESLDFSLEQSSPCISAGDPAPQYSDPDGSRNDIGAFPFEKECPYVFHINFGDDESEHIVNHVPTIFWRYYDPDAPQMAYEIEIGTDSDWTVAEMWATGQVPSPDTLAVYGGVALQDGNTYFIRVRTSNGTKWGDWSQHPFRMNTAPSAPLPSWPGDGASVEAYVLDLSVGNSIDAEGDDPVYEYEIYDDPAMSWLVRYRGGIPEQIDSTLLGPVYDLEPGQQYWWRARSYDGFEYSEWTPFRSFDLTGGAVLRVPDDWPTIQSAFDAAVNGDMVLVAPGTYTENIFIHHKNVRLAGEQGAAVTVLQPADPDQPTLELEYSTKTQVCGFTVSGGRGTDAVFVYRRVRAIISDCRFTGFEGGPDSSAVVRIWDEAIIDGNLFYANNGFACIAQFGDAEITNNTFDRNIAGIFSPSGGSIVKNNIFVHFSNFATYGLFSEFSHNCFWNNSDHCFINDTLWLDPEPENMVADPMFLCRLCGDYRLLPESPCIDAGDPDQQFLDLDGSRGDIGAIPFDLEYPLPVDFNFGPGSEGNVVSTLVPEFFWSFGESKVNIQQQYELEVGTDNDWRVAEMWATGPVISADTHVVYDGWPLRDHTAYVVRIRLHDGERWGSWIPRSFLIRVGETSSDWPTYMGNVLHTGHNPHDRIQPPLERQWAIRVADAPIWPVTIIGDRLFTALRGSGRYVWCFDAISGQLLWCTDYEPKDFISPPSYGYGKIFVQSLFMPSFVSALDIETGEEIWRTPYPNQHWRSLAPAVYDGQVSICGDFYGGVHTFDAQTGEILWKKRLGGLNLCADRWTPSVYRGELFIFIAEGWGWSRLHVLDAESGQWLWGYTPTNKIESKAIGFSASYRRMNTVAVIDTTLQMIFLPDILYFYALDMKTHELVWQVGPGICMNTPAIYNGNVYLIQEDTLYARDAKSGDLIWCLSYGENDYGLNCTEYSSIIANDCLFLSGCEQTYAVDLITHEVIWSYPVSGYVAVSHERLYISGRDGVLHMFHAAPTGVESEVDVVLPAELDLDQNYPNPFNASTRIDYYLPRAGYVKLTIHNILGQVVRILVDEYQSPGEKTVYWDGRDNRGVQVATGIYLYNLQAGDFLKTKEMLLLK